MTMGQLIRARKSEDKAIRREKILKVSRKLFESQGLDSITMDLIAKKADLAKGTLYLYFKTKEEVFLDLQKEELFQWMRILTHQFDSAPKGMSAKDFAELVVSFTEHQNSFMRLLTLLHPVLENNVTVDKAKQFKLELKKEMNQLALAIAKKIEGLTPQTAFTLVFRIYSMIIGLWQTANPPPTISKLLNDPELAIFKIDFGAELKESLIWLISGMSRAENLQSSFDFYKNY